MLARMKNLSDTSDRKEGRKDRRTERRDPGIEEGKI